MSAGVSRFFHFLLIALALAATPSFAQDTRGVVTIDNADYFGFDLRTEREVTLEACEAICLADGECRAFTYNRNASWCFLKSDFSRLNSFPGAIAGRVVDAGDEPDLGAPPALPFITAATADEARLYRSDIADGERDFDAGFADLVERGDAQREAGQPGAAIGLYRTALVLAPEASGLWLSLSRALDDLGNQQEYAEDIRRDAVSAAYSAYELSRTAGDRADALAVLGDALIARGSHRPGLRAYEASLDIDDDADTRATYADLRARYGFRVVDHSIDNDLSAPRACIQFSEDLQRSGADYAGFLRVDGRAPRALDVSERQICVEGLEHGASYEVTLRRGLPSSIGESLENDVPLSIYVQDRPASARFTGPSFVLPSHGRRGLPLVTVNTDAVEVTLLRIGDRSLARLLSSQAFLRQMGQWELDSTRREMASEIWSGTLEVAGEENREVITSFPLDEALPEREPGVYMLTAVPEGTPAESWEPRATQWFVVSDIGLSTFAGEDGLNVFARSLASAQPLQGVELELIAVNNEILGRAVTDAEGRATFTPGLTRGTDSSAPALISASLADEDFVFLDMTAGGFDLTDRGVTGRPAPGALDLYAWTERGIYRAGETVHVAALARDDAAEAVANLPLTFVFTRPDGTQEHSEVAEGRALGFHHVTRPLQPTSMLGNWTVSIHTDPRQPPIAEAHFLVEDFVPDRIEFDLAAEAGEIAQDEPFTVDVDGHYLYGAPAAGMALEGEINLTTTRNWARHPGYFFGLADEELEGETRIDLDALPQTDMDGRADFEAAITMAPSTTRLLSADIVLRMREPGGRAVERRRTLAVTPKDEMIGIRPDFSGDEIAENSNAGFSIIAVAPDGARVAQDGAHWTLQRIERNYQWYRTDGSWNYEPVTVERRIADGRIDIGAGAPARLTMPVEWGRYRLDVESDDPAGPVASVEFNAGWFVEATSTETPDGLEIALDRETYAPGDVARLKIEPRFAGEVLVAVGAERLLETFTAAVPEDGATIDIPVSADWGAGAYVTAVLYRPGEATESRMPARAIGVKWLAVDAADRTIGVTIDAPAQAAPRGPLVVPVHLTNLEAGEEAYVALAAVDVGILNLTAYEAPDPQDWYFGQRQLGLELRDLYGRLIDGSLGVSGRLRTGGDGGGLAMQGSPPTEELVAFFSGAVRVDAEGRAEISFDLPEFNGTVRLMAVAWSREGVGQAARDVIVRDPLVLTAGQPRFLATGDSAAIRLDIANTDGPAGEYALAARVEGEGALSLGALPATVALEEGGNAVLTLPVTADAAGEARILVTLAHEDGTSVERTLFVPVRPPAMPVASQRIVELAPGASLRVDGGLLGGSLLDGAHVAVGVSPVSAFDLPSILMTLDRYPYGCAEQTVSRALPLLYLSELSEISGMEPDENLAARIDDAIARVLTFQTSTGSFGLWGPGYGDLWLDAYIGDFLTRAREKGHAVPQMALDRTLTNLQNTLSYTNDVAARGTEMAYALYVLARNRKASVGDLRYYAEARIDEFASPMARAHLGAALALYGDARRSGEAFASALARLRADPGDEPGRTDYGSPLRDGAAMLALAAETSPSPQAISAMISFVGEARARKTHTSTQEEAWLALAARAVATTSDAIRLEVDGAEQSGGFARRIEGAALLERPLVIANRGADAVDAVVTTVAAPADPLPAGGNGFTIERSYYDLAGEPASIAEASQNGRFVAVLRVTGDGDWPARIAVTDLLPAGFEIDNPRLVQSAELSAFEWLPDTTPAHVEFRSDRFVAAFDREAGARGEMVVAYVVRAVTPGVYVHPAAVVEDMYRPQFNARSAEGMMEVVAGR